MFEKTKQLLQVVSGGIQVGFRWYSGGIGKTKQLTGNVTCTIAAHKSDRSHT